jgi:hypothetical protein
VLAVLEEPGVSVVPSTQVQHFPALRSPCIMTLSNESDSLVAGV